MTDPTPAPATRKAGVCRLTDERVESLNVALGVFWGIVFSLPFWAAVIGVVFAVVR